MNTNKMPRFSARKKNKDLMTLLLSTASFQNEVKALRKQFGIKEGGNSTSEEHEK